MTVTLVEFPRSNIAVSKAIADQTYLLDVLVDGHELMNRASKLVADDIVRSTPELRALLGNAADWMRLFQQTLDQLEQEIKDAAA
jgi:hypothetical protein